jgi:hypothetical protein
VVRGAIQNKAMKTDHDSRCRFREEQRFSQWWLYLLLGVLALSTTTLFGFGIFKQLVRGLPWGDRPMSDTALAVVGPAVILAGWGAVLFLRWTRLVVEVRESGLLIWFRPFVHRNILYREIRTCEARTYQPIREYGGWGIRAGRGGMAYNVTGDRGVQLELVNGKRLLIGSQRAGELAAAIHQRMERERRR